MNKEKLLQELELSFLEQERLMKSYRLIESENAEQILNFLKSIQTNKDLEVAIRGYWTENKKALLDIVLLNKNKKQVFGSMISVKYFEKENTLFINKGTSGEYTSADKGQIARDYFTLDIWNNEQELKEVLKCRLDELKELSEKIEELQRQDNIINNKLAMEE